MYSEFFVQVCQVIKMILDIYLIYLFVENLESVLMNWVLSDCIMFQGIVLSIPKVIVLGEIIFLIYYWQLEKIWRVYYLSEVVLNMFPHNIISFNSSKNLMK